ncbi:Cd2 Antigen Cytoplasmic Tail-Binding Protein 2 [Manis pentadactyla]|nr:Cd2 Antigen Cytoplasmic Tail-Binding Protein 2 [Manis pentadactyla]
MLHFLPSLRSFAKSPEFFGLGPRSYTNLRYWRSWDSGKVLGFESEGGVEETKPWRRKVAAGDIHPLMEHFSKMAEYIVHRGGEGMDGSWQESMMWRRVRAALPGARRKPFQFTPEAGDFRHGALWEAPGESEQEEL